MEQRTEVRYSAAFKQQLIAELESGRFGSIAEARLHYQIGGMCTIQRWLRRYGRNHLMPKQVRVQKPDEADQIRLLREQVQQLQQALGQAHLEARLGESFLRLACGELGTEVEAFKKKVATPPSPTPRRGRA